MCWHYLVAHCGMNLHFISSLVSSFIHIFKVIYFLFFSFYLVLTYRAIFSGFRLSPDILANLSLHNFEVRYLRNCDFKQNKTWKLLRYCSNKLSLAPCSTTPDYSRQLRCMSSDGTIWEHKRMIRLGTDPNKYNWNQMTKWFKQDSDCNDDQKDNPLSHTYLIPKPSLLFSFYCIKYTTYNSPS